MRHRSVCTAEVCGPGLPIFILDGGEFKETNEIHVDFAIVSALFRFLLSMDTGDNIVKRLLSLVKLSTQTLDEYIECFDDIISSIRAQQEPEQR
jgi:hypothetical protein